MPKKGVRIRIIGGQRRDIDVELMTQVIIALGRELAERRSKRAKTQPSPIETAAASTGARP